MPRGEPFRFQTRIRFIDTDASGRIHYTSMFRYFESAEIELLRKVGITYDLRRYYAFPRVHVECDFIRAIAHDDLIEIEAALTKVGYRLVADPHQHRCRVNRASPYSDS